MASNTDSDQDALTNFQDQVKSCAWCKETKVLMNNAKYCRDCFLKSYKVCVRCKLPFPDAKHFKESEGDRCNACHRKYLKEREKRMQKVTSEQPRSIDKQQQSKRPSPSDASTSSSAITKSKMRKLLNTITVSSDSDNSGDETAKAVKAAQKKSKGKNILVFVL